MISADMLTEDAPQRILANDPQRRELFDTLLDNKTERSTGMLLGLLNDLRVPPLYTELLHELGCRNAIDPVDYFQDLIFTENGPPNLESHQLAVLSLLPEYHQHPQTVPMITHILNTSDNRVILQTAVYALACLNTDEAVYILAQLLYEHSNRRVRHHALNCLGICQNPYAVTTLFIFLERDYALTDEGTIPSQCVNAMHGLGRLWKSHVQPFDCERWLNILTYWLYRDQSGNPPALYHLNHTKLPEALTIIRTWERWRDEQHYEVEATVFR